MIAIKINRPRAQTQPRLIILGLLLMALGIATLIVAPRSGKVIENSHAELAHGAEAVSVRQCLQNPNNNIQLWVWRHDPRKWARACQLPDGRWGLQIIQLTWRGWQEKTAFIPKDGSWPMFKEYITAKAIQIK